MQNQFINLIILRHGEAEDGSPDQLRPLSQHGRQQIKRQCDWLLSKGFSADCLLHSPYLRTTETAQIAAQYFTSAKILEEPLITPDGHPEVIAELLPNLGYSNIILISHMPMVSYLSSTLVPEIGLFGFSVASFCWLKLETSQSVLKNVSVCQKLVEVE